MWAWGLDAPRFLPAPLAWIGLAVMIASMVPAVARRVAGWIEPIGDALALGGWGARALAAIVVAVVVIALPDRTWFIGDFLIRMGSLATGSLRGSYAASMPLDTFLHGTLPRALTEAGFLSGGAFLASARRVRGRRARTSGRDPDAHTAPARGRGGGGRDGARVRWPPARLHRPAQGLRGDVRAHRRDRRRRHPCGARAQGSAPHERGAGDGVLRPPHRVPAGPGVGGRGDRLRARSALALGPLADPPVGGMGDPDRRRRRRRAARRVVDPRLRSRPARRQLRGDPARRPAGDGAVAGAPARRRELWSWCFARCS